MTTKENYENAKKRMYNFCITSNHPEKIREQFSQDLAFLAKLVDEHFEEKQENQETNLDHYKDDIAELFIDKLALVDGKPERCKCVIICDNCDLYEKCNEHKAKEELRKWLKQPYKKPTRKLTQFEYDLLQNYNGRLRFINMNTLYCMKEKGYFKGVDEDATIEDILANCEVIK